MDNLWETARDLDERSEPYVMVTVVRRVRPSSATVGDKAIVTADGEMKGFVGGQCTRDLVIDQAKKCLTSGESKLLLVTSQPPADVTEGVTVLPMTCASEGTVELFLEPKNVDPPLVLVGDSPIAHALAELAPRFSLKPCRVSLEELMHTGSAEDPVVKLRNQLHVNTTATAYGVVATMGLYDVDGLLAVASLPLRYLGLVTSPKRWTTVRAELEEAGASSEFINFVTAPAGFDIGAVGPNEIALSILAQIVERRRRGSNASWPGQSDVGTPDSGDSATHCSHVAVHQEVVDPVCGMTVDLAKTPHRLELDGTIYGFCCSGCRDRFARNPEKYLQSHA
ncbi:MAG: XdhC family protein [Alicyclobacillus herbarius]|uniref:XdhC family protein n=1 Tax=Alicyclobacillus herbarius TaxID=122960 RepID=UPI00235411A8|nr:XdhC family protein [Alicyclobacillus herbarius]MCL6634100.1 XdhC family protein [Alicyclobacillus herbarius]